MVKSVEDGCNMNAGLDTYFLRRSKPGPPAAQKSSVVDKFEGQINDVQVQFDDESDAMNIDFPDSSFTDFSTLNSTFGTRQTATNFTSSPPSTMYNQGNIQDVERCCGVGGLASLDIFPLLPRIMSYLSRDDLVNLMLVNRDFHHEGMRMLYRDLSWDIQDGACNWMVIRLM